MTPLRVMTFNLRRDVPNDGNDRWSRRRDAAARLVHHVMPHVLGTQEGLAHQLGDLDARLPWMRRVGTCREGDGSDEHTAIFYDPRRVLLVAWGDFWLSDTPELPGSRSWGNHHPRMATWARFTDQDAGTSFTVVNTHLDHQSSEARARAADYIDQRFPDALLMGDFNDEPRAPAHVTLTRGRRDAHERDNTGTYHGFTGEPRMQRIDWILAPTAWRIARAERLADRVDGRWPSDHFPLWADVMPVASVATPAAAPAPAPAPVVG